MTRATPGQHQRPERRRAPQHNPGQMAFHALPYLAALIVPALLAWWAV